MGLLDNLSSRGKEWVEDANSYNAGDINTLQMGLRSAGGAAGAAGDVVGAAVAPFIPKLILEGITSIADGVMSTGPAKAAAVWMDKNPEQARDIMATLNVGGLLGGGTGAAKGAITKVAHNMPNEFTGFYGNGLLGQAVSAGSAGPTSVLHALKDTLVPSSRAAFDDGISSRLRSVAKKKGALMDAGTDVNKNASFMVGQMDQSSLLSHGAGAPAPALNDIFRGVQEIDAGPMSRERMGAGVRGYKPQQYEGTGTDQNLLDTLHDRVRKAQKIAPDEDVVMVTRHPTALSDIVPESTGGAQASKLAKRMFKARNAMQEFFPDKTSFSNIDELKEFVAARSLIDDTLVRAKDGGKLTRADKAIHKLVGNGKPDNPRYKPKESGYSNITDYYRFKKAVADGPQFTEAELATLQKLRSKDSLSKTAQAQLDKLEHRAVYGSLSPKQVEKYAELQRRVYKGLNNVQVDEATGRVYTQAGHNSSAKGLGGVNDQFAIDLKGNVHHIIDDENDLFGLKIPGDKRVISVTPPTTYNIFRKTGDNARDATGKASKQAHADKLTATYGAANRGLSREGLTRQMADAIEHYKPQVTMKDYAGAAHNYGRMGLLGLLGAENAKENR